jgi:carboxyl-terminal processing protease
MATTLRKHANKIQTVALILAVFTLGFMVGNLNSVSRAQTMGDTDQAFQTIQEVYDIIKSRYVDADKVEVPALVDGALKGMVDSLGDQFSGYLSPSDYATFNTELGGNVEGIGVTIDTNDDDHIYVVALIKGAAAEASGVLPGDIFWEVNGESVEGLDQSELASIVRGPAGTDVEIVFKRGDEFITFTITRVRFEVPNVEYEVLEDDIAYISLATYDSNSRRQLEDALTALDVNARKALILDIRNNPGGLLSAVVDVSSLFVEDGVILYETFGDGSEQIFEANGDFYDVQVPIVLLVNEGSASASELMAGAFKDRDIATIMGETTFGKGTVQNIQPLSNGGGLRITIARWLTPNRNWIHDVGITPDIEVPYDPATDGVDIDPQLDAAIEFINNQ